MQRMAFTVLFCWLGWASSSFAQEPMAAIEISADEASEGCLETEDLALRIAARLGRDPFALDPEAASIRLRLDVRRVGEESVVRLEMLDHEGRSLGNRDWRRAECDSSLRAAVALTLAMLVRDPPVPVAEPEDVTPIPSEAPSPIEEHSSPPAESTGAIEPAPEEPAEPKTPIRFEFLAFALAAFESAPSVVPGLGLDAGLRIGDVFSIGLEGRFDIPFARDAEGGRIEASIAMGALYACARYVYVGGCIIGGAGALRATGYEYTGARTASTLYATFGARLFGEFLLDPVFLHLRFDVLPALARTSLQLSGETVWSLPAVAFTLGAGAGVIF